MNGAMYSVHPDGQLSVSVRVGVERFFIEPQTGSVLGFKPADFDVRLDLDPTITRLIFSKQGVDIGATAEDISCHCLTLDVAFTIPTPLDTPVTIRTPGGGLLCILSLETGKAVPMINIEDAKEQVQALGGDVGALPGPGKILTPLLIITNIEDAKQQVQALGGDIGALQGDGPFLAELLAEPADFFPVEENCCVTSPRIVMGTPTRSPDMGTWVPESPPPFQLEDKRKHMGPETRAAKKLKLTQP